MITNAQLDNERASQTYQIQYLKDKLEDIEELHIQLQREIREKCRDFEILKRYNEKVLEELRLLQTQLEQRDKLIAERGLQIIFIENEDGTNAKCSLISSENARFLEDFEGSLGNKQ